jgi:hypothetical protein
MIRRWLAAVTVSIVVLGALGAGAFVAMKALHPSQPFTEHAVDRSQPALLQSLTDLAELRAAKGQYQVLVDLEVDTKYVPSVVKGTRTVYAATGSVDALVDLSTLGPDAVALSADGRSATITLPTIVLSDPALDLSQSRVVARQRGVLDRIGGAVGDAANPDHDLLLLAERKVGAAAGADTQLRERAEANARETVAGLARSLGVADVTVVFAPAVA